MASTPEAQGIPSRAIINMLDLLDEHAIPMHSFLIMRHGHLVCDAYWAPYTKDTLQRMYSITKSFVSLAIGALITENRIALDDRIVEYFPDKQPSFVPSQLQDTTIRHMLTMCTCHRMTTYKMTDDPDWTRTFFTVPPDHNPGSFFMYDTSSSHVLGSLVERLTGQDLLDYLRRTILADTGFSQDAFIIQDPCGISKGGSGLMATSYDILHTIYAVTTQKTPYRDYLDEACRKQRETTAAGMGNIKDLGKGYGYFIWRFDHNSFGFFGMGGQLAIAVPEYDLFVVTTAFSKGIDGGLQTMMDTIWSLIPSLSPTPLAESEDADELERRIATLTLFQAKGSVAIPVPAYPWEGTYRIGDNPFGIMQLTLKFGKGTCTVHLKDVGRTYSLVAGLGTQEIQPWPFAPSISAAISAMFDSDGVLCIVVHLLWPELGIMRLWVSGNGTQISLKITETIEIEKAPPQISGIFFGEKQ